MTYVIYKLKSNSTGRDYIGYETTESDSVSRIDELIAAMQIASNKCCDPQEHFTQSYLRRNIPENELWKSLRGFMDGYNSIENGYNTEAEYEMVSAQIIKQNLKAATQNKVDSSDRVDWHEPISSESDIAPNPHKSRQVITIGKNDLIYLANENSFSSDTIVLYLYLNVIPGNQITDATLEQAAKDLDLTIGTIKESYNNLMEYGLIEEFRTFQVKRV